MKKLWQRIKDAWYRALPILILLGIPTAICIVIGLINIWDDIPKILNNISTVGNGSLFFGFVLFVFSFIGAINAFIAFMLWFKRFTEWLERLDKKEKPRFLLWIIIIVVTFSWYALFKLIKIV